MNDLFNILLAEDFWLVTYTILSILGIFVGTVLVYIWIDTARSKQPLKRLSGNDFRLSKKSRKNDAELESLIQSFNQGRGGNRDD